MKIPLAIAVNGKVLPVLALAVDGAVFQPRKETETKAYAEQLKEERILLQLCGKVSFAKMEQYYLHNQEESEHAS